MSPDFLLARSGPQSASILVFPYQQSAAQPAPENNLEPAQPDIVKDFGRACAGFSDTRLGHLLHAAFNTLTFTQFKERVAQLEHVESQENHKEAARRKKKKAAAPAGTMPASFARLQDKGFIADDAGSEAAAEEGPQAKGWGAALVLGFAGAVAKIRKSFSDRFGEYAEHEHDDAWEDNWENSHDDAVWSTDPEVDALAQLHAPHALHPKDGGDGEEHECTPKGMTYSH